jgi:hypothetical protein
MSFMILIVCEDEVLCSTRAAILKQWEVATATPDDAAARLSVKRWDLLILCHTVPDDIARNLITQACFVNPLLQVIALSREGQDRHLDCYKHEVDIAHPGSLKEAVARLFLDRFSSIQTPHSVQ